MKNAFNFVFKFFLKPNQDSFSVQTTTSKFKWLLFLFVLEIPFLLIGIFLQNLLFKNGLVNAENHLVTGFLKNNSNLYIVLSGILLIPFFEELIFRLPLRFRKLNFIPFILFILSIAGLLLFKILHLHLFVSVSIFIILCCITALCFINQKISNKLESFLSSNFPYFFFIVTILFALTHLTNFKFSLSLLIFAPIVVLPQFIVGFIIGFIRIKQGFIWGFLLHALHNAVFLLPVLLAITVIKPKLIERIDKDNYTFEVFEGNQIKDYKSKKPFPGYTDSKITRNEIHYFGSFRNAVSKLTQFNKRYIWVKNSFLAEKDISLLLKLNSTYKVETSQLASRLALENLLKAYNLKTKTENRSITAWRLWVFDEKLFQTHVADSAKVNTENISRGFVGARDTLKLVDVNAEFITKTLTIAFDIDIQNDIDKNVVFSIQIPNNDFDKLKQFFESNYGLTIEKTTIKHDMLVVY